MFWKNLVKSKGFAALVLLATLITFLFMPTPEFMKPSWEEYAMCAAVSLTHGDEDSTEMFVKLAIERSRGEVSRREVSEKVSEYALNIILSEDREEAQRAYFRPCASGFI